GHFSPRFVLKKPWVPHRVFRHSVRCPRPRERRALAPSRLRAGRSFVFRPVAVSLSAGGAALGCFLFGSGLLLFRKEWIEARRDPLGISLERMPGPGQRQPKAWRKPHRDRNRYAWSNR